MKYLAGQSGNVNGRPKGSTGLAKYAASMTRDGFDVIDFLVGVMNDKTWGKRERVQAASILLDRVAGKPLQPSELAISLDPPLPIMAIMALPVSERFAWIQGERSRRALPPITAFYSPEVEGSPNEE
jgi:hypothetical protein